MNGWKIGFGLLCAATLLASNPVGAGETVQLRVVNRFEYPVFLAKLKPGAAWQGNARAGQRYRASNNTVKHPGFEFTVPADAMATWNIGGSAAPEDEGLEDLSDPDSADAQDAEPTEAYDDSMSVEAEEDGDVTSVQLTIVNAFRYSLKIYWIDENEERVQFAELQPGERWVVDTYAGHRWVAVNESVKHPGFQYEVAVPTEAESTATWTIRP